jgi:hypothetical protein
VNTTARGNEPKTKASVVRANHEGKKKRSEKGKIARAGKAEKVVEEIKSEVEAPVEKEGMGMNRNCYLHKIAHKMAQLSRTPTWLISRNSPQRRKKQPRRKNI